MLSLEGKVAWITGASAGIGQALARELVSRGAAVALSARRKDRLDELAEELRSQSKTATVHPLDVTDEKAVEDVVEAIARDHGAIDIAIANAGFGVGGSIESLSADDWRRQFDVNVVGAAMTAKYALPHLRESRGRLALVGSVSSMLATPKGGAYSASKYALRAVGQTLSIELAGSMVSCTTLHPGLVESDIAKVDNEGVFHSERQDKRPSRFMWPTKKAAKVMVDAIEARKREYVFTYHGKLAGFVGRHFPGVLHSAMSRQVKKR